MSSLTKNLIIVLGLVTVGFAGYFIFMKQADSQVSFEADPAMIESMMANSQLFIERRQNLEMIGLNTDILSDERFTSLKSYDRPIKEQSIGRSDPFSPTSNN